MHILALDVSNLADVHLLRDTSLLPLYQSVRKSEKMPINEHDGYAHKTWQNNKTKKISRAFDVPWKAAQSTNSSSDLMAPVETVCAPVCARGTAAPSSVAAGRSIGRAGVCVATSRITTRTP